MKASTIVLSLIMINFSGLMGMERNRQIDNKFKEQLIADIRKSDLDPYDEIYAAVCVKDAASQFEKVSWPQVRNVLKNIKRGGDLLPPKAAVICTALSLCNTALMVGSLPYLDAEANNKVPNLSEPNNCPLTSFDSLFIGLSPVFYVMQLLASSYQLKSSIHFHKRGPLHKSLEPYAFPDAMQNALAISFLFSVFMQRVIFCSTGSQDSSLFSPICELQALNLMTGTMFVFLKLISGGSKYKFNSVMDNSIESINEHLKDKNV